MCSDSVSVLASEILDFCDAHSLHIACAESLTGGLLSDSFVKIPGASRVFLGSTVTYDIREKSKILGVDCDLLKSCGAVDARVAKQMAFGAARLYSGSGWCYKRFEQQKMLTILIFLLLDCQLLVLLDLALMLVSQLGWRILVFLFQLLQINLAIRLTLMRFFASLIE